MKSKYQDKWTMWHDKPCKNGEPSSNNMFIYSAYSQYLAPKTVDTYKRIEVFNKCADNELDNPLDIRINRLPEKQYPPLSADEVVGMTSQGLLSLNELEANYWNFCNLEYEKEPLTVKGVIAAIKSLWKIRKEHRNYFWENDIQETYCLAFYLPLSMQYYVKKLYKKRPNLLQTLAFYINFIYVLTKNEKSVRLITWLMLEDLKHPLLKYVNKNKWVRNYFSEDHDFVKNLGDK